ncbi:hypothetical protein FXV83_26840 [Bradyrhizobium hipponense]|uniref:Uncharacterized protein n=1 Tax=Bradyrhizobium hipponense TaxID=2605638 RepID=A0A5S4YJ80_9BRAD|nr:hypothetical protein [Bradyrhizobium hipponense]TYO63527.1 hypothetical protein FXV83_26840 [Bradyrhizobium hipponense]
MLKGFYLTLLMGPTVPVPAPQPVMDALTSAQVTVSAGQASGFQLTFAISKKSPLNTQLLPVGAFDPGIRVILVATVNGLPTVLMDGIITQHTVTPSNEPGQSTLAVTGQDISLMMDLGNGGIIGGLLEIAVPFPSLPTVGIVELVLLKYGTYGIIPLVIPPLQVDVPLVTDGWPTKTSFDSDLSFLKSQAEDVGYVFYIDPGPVPGANIGYFGPEIRIGVPQPALNIDMDAETNVESLHFTYDGMAREQPVITILDPITGKIPISIPIPDVSILRPPLALRPAPAMRMAPLEDVANLDPIPAALLGIAASAKPDAITGSGSLDVLRYGRPLKARQLVGVRGAGSAYDGLYYVSSVTHSIKRGEYKQNFSLAREGLISLTPRVIP